MLAAKPGSGPLLLSQRAPIQRGIGALREPHRRGQHPLSLHRGLRVALAARPTSCRTGPLPRVAPDEMRLDRRSAIVSPMSGRILIVDDEPDMVENCVRILRPGGHRCVAATDARRALDLLETERPDLLLTDLRMPEIDGMALLHRAHELDAAMPVIVMTGFATIESAVEAVKGGAFDFLPKTFSVEQLRVAIDRALRHRGLQVENTNLRNQLQQVLGFESIIGTSPAITRVFELVKKAARSEANILVVGESGTGKELIARAIHANSPRAA